MPRIVLLGGPNGAGKTTTAMRTLPDFLSLREYVNADTIAAGLSAFVPESVALVTVGGSGEETQVQTGRLHAAKQTRAWPGWSWN